MSAPGLGEHLIWDRFWARREVRPRYDADGFLIEPRTHYGVSSNPDVIRLHDLAPESWVIALGEPGIGKSTFLQREYKRRKAEGLLADFVDLHSIGTPEELNRHLFGRPLITEWCNAESASELHLFIDSFDECRMRIDTLSAVLERDIATWPTERLRLLIGCRTADWPRSLESALEAAAARRHGGNAVIVLQLLPLSRERVLAAAREAGIDDPYAFLSAVRTAGVGPLVTKPLTLKFLLHEYTRSGALSSGQAELYRRGCLQLCVESDERRDVKLLPRLEPDQRVAVASRLAAISMFANRDAFWRGSLLDDCPAADLAVSTVFGSTVAMPQGETTRLTRELVDDTFATGLFSARGDQRLGWVHQTFAEYLAACALANLSIPISTVKKLLYHEDGRVASQLRETAAWLAGMRRDVFQALAFDDPEVLLRSDVGTLETVTEADRREWVESLFAAAQRGRISARRLRFSNALLSKLRHPALDAQVRSVLADRASGSEARWLAVHIAAACELRAVHEELLAIALERSEELQLRVLAAFALIGLGPDETIAQLRPLLCDPKDKDQELLGTALIGLWPKHLAAAELFPLLSLPEEPGLNGSYKLFLRSHLSEGLADADIATAIDWLIPMRADYQYGAALDVLAEQLARRAAGMLDDDRTARALARLIASALTSHASFQERLWGEEREREACDPLIDRVRLLPLILDELPGGAKQNADRLWYERFVKDTDIPEIAQALLSATDRSAKEGYALVLAYRLRQYVPPQFVNDVLAAYHDGDVMTRELLARFFAPVELKSPEAKTLKEKYDHQMRLREEYEQRDRNEKRSPYDWAGAIQKLVDQGEQGTLTTLNVWRNIVWTLAITDDGDHQIRAYESEPDITALPGWKGIDEAARDRIITAGHHFIEHYTPLPERWIGTNQYVPGDWAGYQALELLWRFRRPLVEHVPALKLAAWAPVIAAFPDFSSSSDSEQRNILAFVEPIAPVAIAETIDRLFATETEDYRLTGLINRIDRCSSAELQNMLLEQLDTPPPAPVYGAILKWLLERQNHEALTRATAMVTNHEAELDTRVAAGRCLLTLVPGGAWPEVGPVFLAEPDFGKALAHSLT